MKKLLPLLAAAVFLYPQLASAVNRTAAAGSGNTNVSIRLADPAGAVYVADEPIHLTVQTDADAHILVFNIDTEGFVHLLYPADSGSFRSMGAVRQLAIPTDSRETFLVEGATGLEMVFALAVKDKDDLDDLEVSFLMNNANLPRDSQYRVEGDPFVAVNDIVSRLVRGIEADPSVTLAYTYFYVNEAVDFPRYMCTDCYENGTDPYADNMPTYTPTVAFDASAGLAYPLAQAFEQIVPVAQPTTTPGVIYETQPEVTHVYVHYPAPRYYYYPTSWYYWDYYWWRPYCAYPAPYYGGFYFSVGWNWGYWGYNDSYGYGYRHGGTVVVDNRYTRPSVRNGRYKSSGGSALYGDLQFKNRDQTAARREGMRSKTASTTNSRKVASNTRTKGIGGPTAQLRPQTARTKSGSDDRPIAQLRPQAARTKGGSGGPMIQPRAGGGSGDARSGKQSRTVKPLTRQTRGTFSNPDRRTYDPRNKNNNGPSIQSRSDRTRNLKSRGPSTQSKYRTTPKSRSSGSIKGSNGRNSSAGKSRAVSRPSSSNSSSKVRSGGSRSTSSRSGGAGKSSSSSRGRGKSR